METVGLWHGTTLEEARAVRKEGFRPADVEAELESVAQRYDVTVEQLRQSLEEHSRFAVIQLVRNDFTWLTTTEAQALAWASRAPEVRWEALWAVWWLTRDPDDDWPWGTPAAAGWHAQQLLESEPAIVELDVPINKVLDFDGTILSPERVCTLVEIGAPELAIEPPGDVLWVKSISPTRRPVDFVAVAGILRMSVDDLEAAINDGKIPDPHPPEIPGMPWTWFEDELKTFIPEELLHAMI